LEELGVGVLALVAVRCALLELGQHVARGRHDRSGAAGPRLGLTGRALGVVVEVHGGLSCGVVVAGRGGHCWFSSVPAPPGTDAACSTTRSMKPYSRASGAVNQRSRSASRLICS